MLRVVCGPMFSGKTSEVLSHVRRLRAIGWSVLVVNHALDDRGGTSDVRSHDGGADSTTVSVPSLEGAALWAEVERHRAVVVDEAQFFGPDLVAGVRRMLAAGKDVLVVGLDGDYLQRPFGHVHELLPLADEFVKQSAFCAVCQDGTRAPFTRRRGGGDGEQQVAVGAAEAYLPVCRRHL